jgi:hypothetical protein
MCSLLICGKNCTYDSPSCVELGVVRDGWKKEERTRVELI